LRSLHPLPLPDQESAMARTIENTAKKDQSKDDDTKLDEALDDTFPASDPPSITDPTKHIGNGKGKPQSEQRKPVSP
jgi:hypothetical protein